MPVKQKDKIADKFLGWQSALADVEREILRSENKIKHLRRSAKIIRNKIEAQEPWPELATKRNAVTPNQ